MDPNAEKTHTKALDPSVEIEKTKSHYDGETYELKVRTLRIVYPSYAK